MIPETITHINFRVNREDIILFKKELVLFEQQENTKIKTKDFFVLILKKVKDFLQKENLFLNAENDISFIENFSYVGKKNLKIQDPKKLLISISEQEKKLYYDVAYSIIKQDKSDDLSYPYAFKRILEINQIINNE